MASHTVRYVTVIYKVLSSNKKFSVSIQSITCIYQTSIYINYPYFKRLQTIICCMYVLGGIVLKIQFQEIQVKQESTPYWCQCLDVAYKFKRGAHNSCKNVFIIICLLVISSPFHKLIHILSLKEISLVIAEILQNVSFCTTMTTTTMQTTPRLEQYLGFSLKTAKLKISSKIQVSNRANLSITFPKFK